jgi:trk system potassium uptake protein TrkA
VNLVYIIIIGCGNVGFHLTRALLYAGHEVLVVEQNAQKHAHVVNELGSVSICGDGSEWSVLEEAGAARADALIAVTGSDASNLMACQVAKYHFRRPKTIALIDNPENHSLFEALGVNVIVSHINMILTHVEEELPDHPLVHLLEIQGSERRLVAIHVPPDAQVIGKSLGSVDLPPGVLIPLLIPADGEPALPIGDRIFHPHDKVIAVASASAETLLLDVLTRVAE